MKKILLLVAALVLTAPVFAQMNRHEVSVSYGAAPSSYWIDRYAGDWINTLFGDVADVSSWGAMTMGYNFRLTGGLSVGAQLVYSSNKTKEKGNSMVAVTSRYWSVMPNVKWNWINLRIVSFYSRLGAGLAFAKAKGDDGQLSTTQFAFQVSPVGIEVGGALAGYAEIGLGNSGSFLAGVRYRF